MRKQAIGWPTRRLREYVGTEHAKLANRQARGLWHCFAHAAEGRCDLAVSHVNRAFSGRFPRETSQVNSGVVQPTLEGP
jgi:hypothetical protein